MNMLRRLKRIPLAAILFVVVLGGFFIFNPQSTLASTRVVGNEQECKDLGGTVIGGPRYTYPAGVLWFRCDIPDGNTDPGISGNPVPNLTGGEVGSKLDCGFLEWSCLAGKAFYFLIYNTLGVLVGVAAWFLDKMIEIGIFGFSEFVNQASGIVLAWQIFRDVITITLIFALLYAAIRMILGVGKYKEIIKGVIVAGLLINFTFFLTSVVIDASNVLTVELKKAVDRISDTGDAGVAGGVLDAEQARTTGITAVFMQNLKLSTIPESAIEGTGKEMDTHIFQNILFTSILLLIVAIVFFTMGLLFFTRFITLIILLIASPIAVVGDLFPQLKSYEAKWWKVLIGQAIFAPLMMLCILISVMVMTSAAQVPLLQGDLVSPDGIPYATGFSNLLNYAVVIGLLIGSIIIAQSGAGPLAKGLTDWASKKTKAIAFAPGRFAQAGAVRVAKIPIDVGKNVVGAVGRNTVGRISGTLGKGYDRQMAYMKNLDPKSAGKWSKPFAYVDKGIAATLSATGADEKIRNTFKSGEQARFGSKANLEERAKQKTQRKRELGQTVREEELEQTLKDGLKATEEAFNGVRPYDSSKGPIKDFVKEVSFLTDKKLEEMFEHDLKTLQSENFAGALTAKQMDFINKTDLISDPDKEKIRNAQKSGLMKRINAPVMKSELGVPTEWGEPTGEGLAEVDRILSGNPTQVAKLPPALLKKKEVAKRLSSQVLSTITREASMSESDRAEIRSAIESAETEIDPDIEPIKQEQQARRLEKAKKWLDTDAGMAF